MGRASLDLMLKVSLDCDPGVGRAGFSSEGSTGRATSKPTYVMVVNRIQFLLG